MHQVKPENPAALRAGKRQPDAGSCPDSPSARPNHGAVMRVVAVTRDPGRARAHAGLFDSLHPVSALLDVLPRVDAVVLILPQTDETAGMIGDAPFATFRPGAVFINIGRGSVVDEAALLRHLRSGRIGFAALDVAAQEPLPPESLLWDMSMFSAARIQPAPSTRRTRTHAQMMVELIAGMRAEFGDAGLDRLLAWRDTEMAQKQGEKLRGACSLAERVARLVQLRWAEDYMAVSVRRGDGTYVIVENHCPICGVSKACQGFCRSELALFARLLAPAQVSRTEHLPVGAQRCCYLGVPAGRRSARVATGAHNSPVHNRAVSTRG